MSKTLARHIRIDEQHWRRIESLANERGATPNQLLVELAIEALDLREWPQNLLQIQMLRSCLFTAQATARDMTAAGHCEEVEAIRREISRLVPDPAGRTPGWSTCVDGCDVRMGFTLSPCRPP